MELTPRKAEVARRLLRGETPTAIAAALGVSRTRIYQIRDALARDADRALESAAERKVREETERAEREQAKRSAEEQRQRALRGGALWRLEQQIQPLRPTWFDLNNFGYWLRQQLGHSVVGPRTTILRTADQSGAGTEYRQAQDILNHWLEDRANETMTVLRLRRLAGLPLNYRHEAA